MQFFTLPIIIAVIARCSEAKLINVDVGDGGLSFKPSVIVADIGDQVQFIFYNNHSVVQSNFIDPCIPIENGFYSGFVASETDGPAKDSFVVTVETKNAIWFYCSQGGHCQSGMSGVINSGKDALDSYMDAALLAPNNVSPTSGVSGGKLGPIISSLPSSKTTRVSSTTSTLISNTKSVVSTTPTTHKSSSTSTHQSSSTSTHQSFSTTTHQSSSTTTHKSSPTTIFESFSTASNKVSVTSAADSKTKPTISSTKTPSSSTSHKHHRSKTTTALAIISAVASFKTSSCTWRG